MSNLYVIKKDGTKEEFDINKVLSAVSKSADRVMYKFTDTDLKNITSIVYNTIEELNISEIPILKMHSIVEKALSMVNDKVTESYRSYRNYKTSFVHMLDDVYKESQRIMYIGDKENSNTDSALVSTKRSLIFNQLNKELYKKFFLTVDELQACKEGFIYIHDMSARRDTINCCLFDMATVLKGGFEMGNVWYNEPKTLDTAFDVISDVILSAASQQYGGFTVAEIDKILEPYAEKSFKKYKQEYIDIVCNYTLNINDEETKAANEYAMRKVKRDFEQGFQGLEYKLNTVSSSRGDYPFTTLSFGLATSEFGKMASKTCLEVRMNGQGKEGKKRAVLFPKLVFLYDENLHGEGKELEDVFETGIKCSSKCMYPDWLSLTGSDGYLQTMYKKYGKVISPMGCRAFLSPYYERGGFEPADKDDEPIFISRFNCGVVSLHLPMILAKSRKENRDFYEVLDYYLEMIRDIHKRTKDYLGEMKASINPLGFCEGGFWKGHLQPYDKIKPILESSTFSYGITALNELQMLYNKKSLVEDGAFALEVMEYINDKINQYKKEDHMLYAIYGTPAENLVGLQVKQFRSMYNIVEGVSDKEYVSNSFHCHVTEKITPIEKQDLEGRFWELFKGGRIQYVRYPLAYNLDAIKTLVRRAMDKGFYEGVNLSLSYCDDCGYEQLSMDECPECGSKNITKIDRMNGYLSYSRIKGDTRLNDAKMAEIKDRVSM